ncbi:MAG: cyclic pyranopterin monophosphate synthase MoaC [Candidatus Thermoplasmatota archaeon]|nr:cyclic pyranopterin monophosphate synthase MoaC [Candidatus Thermoplasmatota archaeon]MCL5794341.1 cyclic pyranopterin monophosphate synthase MoaC [Candidatus Thermoplasmatota archaeon]
MIDISGKEVVLRTAVASGFIRLKGSTMSAIRDHSVKKGDVLEVARTAGMFAVKRTPETIPHCHNIPIESVRIDFVEKDDGIEARCRVSAHYRTGVEMEALNGVSVALLTIWDMTKYLEKDDTGNYPSTRMSDIVVELKEKSDDRSQGT